MSGFQPNLSPEGQYHTLAEVEILANIASGYYVHSLHSITVEGETGMILMDNRSTVQRGANSDIFPGFFWRGYARLEFGSDERVLVQWVFPSLSKTTNYQFFVRYRNIGSSRRVNGMVSQRGNNVNTRITFVRDSDCSHPCYAHLENATALQRHDRGAYPLNDQDPVTITLTLSSTNILLDAIIALPEEFFNPSNSSNIDYVRFMQECNISNGELRYVSTTTTSINMPIQHSMQASESIIK